MMNYTKNLLVVIPHSGLRIPREIPNKLQSQKVPELIRAETDWYTNLIYDFRDILQNRQLVFPYNQVFINACRHPKRIDDCCPLEINGNPVYSEQPSLNLRKRLIQKYLDPFYRSIRESSKSFILDGHSHVKRNNDNLGEVIEDDIIISDLVTSDLDPKEGLVIAPKSVADFYADQLKRRLPKLRIGRNSAYLTVYDHILSQNSWDGIRRKGRRVPCIHQETNENLYVKNGKPIKAEINRLRRAFAESLYETMKHFNY